MKVEITREMLMQQLNITELQISTNSQRIPEALFCLALIQQGTEITARVLSDYIRYHETLYGEKK